MSERYRGKVRAPEFPAGLDWLNVEQPLTLQALRGKVVILDFWTFCCINCQHVLPQLRRLEERFPEELVVIGVHSAKFDAEKETYNIRAAVMRHDVRHAVVNDRDFLLWRAYASRAWPTIVLIDPDGYIIGGHSGEFDAGALGDLLEEIIRDLDSKGKIDRTPVSLLLEKRKQLDMLLSFPGGVVVDAAQWRLFVADSNHHRVLQFDLRTGRLQRTFGTGEPGLVDGSGRQARFNMPQGLALQGESLYVADTENHAVRKIALEGGIVMTLAGTGQQAQPLPVSGMGRFNALNSPWDVLLVEDRLFIAMAGSHQIWTLSLRSGRLEPFAGDGKETLGDGAPLEAHLAQPSGLAAGGARLWFADSETSSLRSLPLAGDGPVTTAIGEGLFEFGDRDGARAVARLQHPLAVACADDLVYVADSYNNRIKVFDPATGLIQTLAGSGEPGMQDGTPEEACFWEPGGLCAAGEFLYVADTNNQAIRVVHRRTGQVQTLDLEE